MAQRSDFGLAVHGHADDSGSCTFVIHAHAKPVQVRIPAISDAEIRHRQTGHGVIRDRNSGFADTLGPTAFNMDRLCVVLPVEIRAGRFQRPGAASIVFPHSSARLMPRSSWPIRQGEKPRI